MAGEARLVDGEAGGEVVAGVDDHVGLVDQFAQQPTLEARLDGGDGQLGIERQQGVARRVDLGAADVGGGVDDLSLQVAEVDLVVVDQDQVADAGRGEVHRHRRAQSAEADHQRRRREQPHLPGGVDLRQHDLPTVAQQLFVFEVHRGRLAGRRGGRQVAAGKCAAQGARAAITRGCPAGSRWSTTST